MVSRRQFLGTATALPLVGIPLPGKALAAAAPAPPPDFDLHLAKWASTAPRGLADLGARVFGRAAPLRRVIHCEPKAVTSCRRLGVVYSMESVQDLRSLHGIDPCVVLGEILSEEIGWEILRDGLRQGRAAARRVVRGHTLKTTLFHAIDQFHPDWVVTGELMAPYRPYSNAPGIAIPVKDDLFPECEALMGKRTDLVCRVGVPLRDRPPVLDPCSFAVRRGMESFYEVAPNENHNLVRVVARRT